MITYRLIIDDGKTVDDEFYTSRSKLLHVINSLLKSPSHKIDVMEYEGTKDDELENYRKTLNTKLEDKGY